MKVTVATRAALTGAIRLVEASGTRVTVTTPCGPVRIEDELQRLYDSIEDSDVEPASVRPHEGGAE